MSASIALSLSGGGYRATLFHAGALRRLAELGVLDRITHVSAVSGGAIAAGVWADDLRTHPGGDARDRARRIEARILAFCKEKIDTGTIIGGMLNPFKSVNETLIGAYRKHLFRDDPRLDQMIETWREAQREALHRLPQFPWEGARPAADAAPGG